MNRSALAATVLAAAIAVGAGTGSGLHALGWELRPDTGLTVGGATPSAHAQRRAATPATLDPAKTPTPVPAQPRMRGTTLHLLTADQVGEFNASWRWIIGSTQSGEGKFIDAFCQQSSLASLGASAVTRRDFIGASRKSNDTDAGQLLATFPSPGAAAKAYQAMLRWRATCSASMHKRGFTTAKVRPLQQVATNAERAGWWLGIFTPVNPDLPNAYTNAGWFAATGIAQDGDTVTVVWINVIGQDYSYDTGNEPMARTLVNAASVVGSG